MHFYYGISMSPLRRFIGRSFLICFIVIFFLFGLLQQDVELISQRPRIVNPKTGRHLEAKRYIGLPHGKYRRDVSGNERCTLEELKIMFKHQKRKCPFRTKFNFSESPLPKTALTSFPGSGNTWLRHLLQQATGLFTGSIYCDESLQKAGLGECLANQTDRVIAEKVHEPEYHSYDRVILLVRDPTQAIRSFFNYRFAGHKKSLNQTSYKSLVWLSHVNESLYEWRKSIEGWLSHFPDNKIHVISYHDLVSDIVGELQDMLAFLEMPVTPRILWCTYLNRHGQFKRTEKAAPLDEDLYTPSAKNIILRDKIAIEKLVSTRFPHRKFTLS